MDDDPHGAEDRAGHTRAVGDDGATLGDQIVHAMAVLHADGEDSGPTSILDVFDFDGDPPPNLVLPLRQVLGATHGEDDADDDPYGLWELAAALRSREPRYLVYGIVGAPELVVGDAVLVYAIAALRDRIDEDDADWEQDVPWLQSEMSTLLPEDLVERYGETRATQLSGDAVHIAPQRAEALVRALRRRGYSCHRDDEAVARACGF